MGCAADQQAAPRWFGAGDDQSPILWPEGEAVVFEVKVMSYDDWAGYFSFRSHLSARRSVRLPVRLEYYESLFNPSAFSAP